MHWRGEPRQDRKVISNNRFKRRSRHSKNNLIKVLHLWTIALAGITSQGTQNTFQSVLPILDPRAARNFHVSRVFMTYILIKLNSNLSKWASKLNSNIAFSFLAKYVNLTFISSEVFSWVVFSPILVTNSTVSRVLAAYVCVYFAV